MFRIIDGPSYYGYYESFDKLIRVVLSLINALRTVMLSHVAHAFHAGLQNKVDSYLQASFDIVSMIALPHSLGIVAVSAKLAPWLFGSQFSIVGGLLQLRQ